MRVSVFDICRRSPCRNGGTCNGNGQMYYCNCPTPYYGKNCTCKYNLMKANNDARALFTRSYPKPYEIQLEL